MRRRGAGSGVTFVAALVAFIVAVLVQCGVYSWSKADCRDRGGHTEITYGKYLHWKCEDAER